MPTNTSALPTAAERHSAGIGVDPALRATQGEFGIVIDGAVAYSLRLIPSNKVLGRFASTHAAWSGVVTAVDAGRSPRTLVLDWHGADGSRGPVSSGVNLEYIARSGLGLPADHLRSPDQRRD